MDDDGQPLKGIKLKVWQRRQAGSAETCATACGKGLRRGFFAAASKAPAKGGSSGDRLNVLLLQKKKQELQLEKNSVLRKRCVALGYGEDDMEKADDARDTKLAYIELIVAKSSDNQGKEVRQQQPEDTQGTKAIAVPASQERPPAMSKFRRRGRDEELTLEQERILAALARARTYDLLELASREMWQALT